MEDVQMEVIYRRMDDTEALCTNIERIVNENRCNQQLPEVQTIGAKVFKVVESLVNRVGLMDSRLQASEILKVGSFHEDTKLGDPDEFDFLVVLKMLSIPGALEVKTYKDPDKEFRLVYAQVMAKDVQERFSRKCPIGQDGLPEFATDWKPKVWVKEERFLEPFTAGRFLRCFMSSKGDHLDRTAENARESIISPATVIAIREECKTVKGLTLKIEDRKLTFKAGQWVDTMIPGVQTVGGFSMCSAPDRLSREGVLDLAVKYSDHPPAHWVHTQCSIGSQVAVRVGGDFYFDPKPSDPTRDLLLIAGGVGINPLYCIINHVTELNLKLKGDNSSKGDNSCYIPGKVLLLYSAGEKEELIFRDSLQKIVDFHENIQCRYFVSREQNQPEKDLECRRITCEDISRSFDWLDKSHVTTYICGPSPMIEDMEKFLLHCGIDQNCIHYEKWW